MRSTRIEPRLFVIVYQGQEIPEEMAENFVDAMVTANIAPVRELVQVKWFDANDLSKLVGVKSVNTSEVIEHTDEDVDPIIQSLIYIGGTYNECKKDIGLFALRLSADLRDAEYQYATGKPHNESLLTAVEILSTKTINRKYIKYMNDNGVTKEMLNVISSAYMYHKRKYVS